LLQAGIKRGMRVADLGCGTGMITQLLAELVGPTGEVVGVDYSAAQVVQARELLPAEVTNVRFVAASATDTGLAMQVVRKEKPKVPMASREERISSAKTAKRITTIRELKKIKTPLKTRSPSKRRRSYDPVCVGAILPVAVSAAIKDSTAALLLNYFIAMEEIRVSFSF